MSFKVLRRFLPPFLAKTRPMSCSNLTDSMSRMISKHGYPVEHHKVATEDSYILTLFRIPGSSKATQDHQKPVVLLQHGLLCSSADYVVLGANNALSFLLADAGYDVWLGNARGNKFSREHQWLTVNSREFWDFSWHEIGVYDIPAMIDYVLASTGQTKLHYVGHSQGTTAFFVMGSHRNEYNGKVKSMHALAPVAFMSQAKSPFFQLLAQLNFPLRKFLNLCGVYEYPSEVKLLELLRSPAYRYNSLVQRIVAVCMHLIGGGGSNQIQRSLIPEILRNTLAGSSMAQVYHYAQLARSKRFCSYDHGFVKNLEEYGSPAPLDYRLDAVTAPVFLHYSRNDWLAAVKDVEELGGKLGNVVGKRQVPYDAFNHLDFLYGKDAKTLVYDVLIESIQKYN